MITKFFDIPQEELDYRKAVTCVHDPNPDEDWAVEVMFKYWRKRGYPHYTINEIDKHQHIQKLANTDVMQFVDGDTLKQALHCTRLAWSYFPHAWEVKCGSGKSPVEVFNDDTMLRRTLRHVWRWTRRHADTSPVTENRIRQHLKIYSGAYGVSNFRPASAAAIYEMYGGDGVVWDMSCGWGGRLIGALTSKRVKRYIGTEPSTKTYNGLLQMKEDFEYFGKEVEIHCKGSEDFIPEPESLDLCFTSPPYFDTEKYADEPTQSYIKFPTEDAWLNGFMRQTLQNCWYGLKPGGHLILNIANTKTGKNIEEGTLSLAKELGFEYIRTMKLELSSVAGKGSKFEPIFVFQK